MHPLNTPAQHTHPSIHHPSTHYIDWSHSSRHRLQHAIHQSQIRRTKHGVIQKNIRPCETGPLFTYHVHTTLSIVPFLLLFLPPSLPYPSLLSLPCPYPPFPYPPLLPLPPFPFPYPPCPPPFPCPLPFPIPPPTPTPPLPPSPARNDETRYSRTIRSVTRQWSSSFMGTDLPWISERGIILTFIHSFVYLSNIHSFSHYHIHSFRLFIHSFISHFILSNIHSMEHSFHPSFSLTSYTTSTLPSSGLTGISGLWYGEKTSPASGVGGWIHEVYLPLL